MKGLSKKNKSSLSLSFQKIISKAYHFEVVLHCKISQQYCIFEMIMEFTWYSLTVAFSIFISFNLKRRSMNIFYHVLLGIVDCLASFFVAYTA